MVVSKLVISELIELANSLAVAENQFLFLTHNLNSMQQLMHRHIN